jgi:cyclohexyl-isocyanide hydratase
MNRREFALGAVGAAGLGLLDSVTKANAEMKVTGPAPTFVMLIYPRMILQDLVGPLTVFNLTMGKIHLVWKDKTPVITDVGISVTATHTFEDCPRTADVLFVPGGLGGTTELLDDEATLSFLRELGGTARYVTSVCTGSLALGAAGLLRGKKATSHWYAKHMLPLFGAIPTAGRVVEDGNVITAGGVTAGIDFGLILSARLRGEEWAKRTQLTLEYDPQPPFVGGTPEKAGEEATQDILRVRAPALATARAAAERAGARLRG